jgi:hypothetical protein
MLKESIALNLKTIPNIQIKENRVLTKIRAWIKVLDKSLISIINMKKKILKVFKRPKIKFIKDLKTRVIKNLTTRITKILIIRVIKKKEIIVLNQELNNLIKLKITYSKVLKKNDF